MVVASNSQTPEVTISHLKIDAPQSARSVALESLDRTRWPSDGPAETPWLILRRLEVSSVGWDLGPRASAAAQTISLDAVSGWLSSASDADVVSFENLADLVACLSKDIALGQAERLWYWQHWKTASTLPAMTQLWADHIIELPEIVRSLVARDALAVVVSALTVESILALVQRVRQDTAWALPPLLSPDELTDKMASTNISDHDRYVVNIPEYVTAVLPTDKHAAAAIAQLFIILQIWKNTPQVLLNETVAASVIYTSARTVLKIPSSIPAVNSSQTYTDRTELIENVISHFVDSPDHISAEAIDGSLSESDTAGSALPERDVSEKTTKRVIQTPEVDNSSVEQLRTNDSLDTYVFLGDGIVTQHGGVFYLINALNNQDVCERLFASGDHNGWSWLWHLSRSFGLEPDAALMHFFLVRLDQDAPAALLELQPPPEFDTIKQSLDTRYRHSSVWDSALLTCPAVIRLTASHLDIYIPFAHARVDVRRLGLDRDPGWVDWLGRVVAFHFDSVPELAGRLADE